LNRSVIEPKTCESLPLNLIREYTFALLPPEQRPLLPDDFPSVALAVEELVDSAEWLPHLINLRELTAVQFGGLLDPLGAQQQAEEPPLLCALLKADCCTERLHQHLSHAQIQRGPRGAKAWLRLHDPRVWLQLPRVLSTETLRALFGPVSAWTVPFDGAWLTSEPPQMRMPGATRHEARRWEALLRIGAVNRALAQLKLNNQEGLPQASAVLDALVERAQQRHGLNRVDDQVAFACFGWQTHPQFDQHPLVQEGLLAARSEVPPAELVDVLARLTPSLQQRIRADLGGSGENREHP
jgi:hypothetical protein